MSASEFSPPARPKKPLTRAQLRKMQEDFAKARLLLSDKEQNSRKDELASQIEAEKKMEDEQNAWL